MHICSSLPPYYSSEVEFSVLIYGVHNSNESVTLSIHTSLSPLQTFRICPSFAYTEFASKQSWYLKRENTPYFYLFCSGKCICGRLFNLRPFSESIMLRHCVRFIQDTCIILLLIRAAKQHNDIHNKSPSTVSVHADGSQGMRILPEYKPSS